ncbi:glycosyltransferase family 4 protein [Patescibacteria group bacterium]|nr:glycosyltransferase family 4 protein [Patescibacteria group bacterium]
MRVHIVSPVFPPYKGGMGVVAAREYALLRDAGVAARVFTPRYTRDQLQASDAQVHLLDTQWQYGNAALCLGLFFKLRQTDVIHLHYPFYGSDLVVTAAAWWWGIPLVVTYHMQARGKGILGILFKLHRWFLEPIVLRTARAVIVSSLEYAQSLGVRHHGLVAVPFGVDAELFKPSLEGDLLRTQMREEIWKFSKGDRLFLFVGGMDAAHHFKGVELFLRALSQAREQQQNIKAVFVGDGGLRSFYEGLAEDLGLSSSVRFLGAVSDEELVRAYQVCDAHVLPSISQAEAYGLVTLQAAACGLPSLVSDLPGVRTLVVPEETGWRVPVCDVEAWSRALVRASLDPVLLQTMGKAARERAVKRYSTAMERESLISVYKAAEVC